MTPKATRFTSAQEACITFPNGGDHKTAPAHLIIEAGAGAGKTAVLAERVRWKITEAPDPHRCAPQELVLATFTRAADRELRERVEGLLMRTQDPQWARATSLLQISTIDSLLMSLFECYFQKFWEEAFLDLTAPRQPEVAHSGRYQMTAAPQPELIDEEGARAEMGAGLSTFFQSALLRGSGLEEAVVLDFLLAGAFKGPPRGPAHGKSPREQILSFLLSETCLLLSEQQPAVIQESVHPAMPRVFRELINWGRSCHLLRLRRGRITHTDRLVFLHNLICAEDETRRGTPYGRTNATLPFSFKELIVDEYQDTNPAQHQLLFALVTQAQARMVVVGDPKQSLYGFRRAKVGVFHELKSDPSWHHVELVKNFRSRPELLTEINTLSRLALNYEDPAIPAAFWQSPHGVAARKSLVRSLDLEPGRAAPAEPASTTHATEPAVVKVRSHSLNATRYPQGVSLPGGVDFAELSGELLISAVRAELQQGTPASSCVVLCETNRDCSYVAETLVCGGVPAAAAGGAAGRALRQTTEPALPQRVAITICALLAPGLDTPVLALARQNTLALFEVMTSPLLGFGIWSAARICTGLRTDEACADPALQGAGCGKPERALWEEFCRRLDAARQVALSNIFAAWKLMVEPLTAAGIPQAARTTEAALDSDVATFQHMLDAWALRFARHLESDLFRQQLQDPVTARGWTNPLSDLSGLLPADLTETVHLPTPPPDPGALAVMTVHGAKGLQWPVVFFFPGQTPQKSSAVFRCLDFSDRSVVQWLSQPVEPMELFARTGDKHPNPFRVRVPGLEPTDPDVASDLELQERAEKMFERSRVFYTAVTRAAEKLYLFAPKGRKKYKKSLRDVISDLTPLSSDEQKRKALSGFIPYVLGSYLDEIFQLRSVLPEGKKTGKKPVEPWISSECAQRHADKQSRLVEYCDFAAPSFAERAGHSEQVERARHTLRSHQADSTNGGSLPEGGAHDVFNGGTGGSSSASREVAHQRFSTERANGFVERPAQTKDPDADRHLWLGDWAPAHAAKEDSTAEGKAVELSGPLPKVPQTSGAKALPETPHEQDAHNPVHEGLLFHAEREYLGDAGSDDALGELERSAALVLKEFEIWTEHCPDRKSPVNAITCAVPSRHIVDLIAICRAADLPTEFRQTPVYAASDVSDVPERVALEVPTGGTQTDPVPEQELPSWIAVIVDYKTGAESDAHDGQMRRYLGAVSSFLKTGALEGLLQDTPEGFTPGQLGVAGVICYVQRVRREGTEGPEHRRQLRLRPVRLNDAGSKTPPLSTRPVV